MENNSHTAKMTPAELPEEDLAKLSAKQRLYLENRLQGMPVKTAAAAAGYMSDSSRVYKDLEEHPRIKRLMLDATKVAFQKITVTRADVIQGFMDAVNAAQSSTELVMAWREIGKVIGAYEPEVKVVKHIDITAEKVRSMKDEDLLKLADMESFMLPDMEADIIEGEFAEIDDYPDGYDDFEADTEADTND